ncbi:hypothetical protein AAVH_19305 [Aphelenchoides avenae]|nr:hypothetical protein AAVH_19305 [Aphelenchus avenae]
MTCYSGTNDSVVEKECPFGTGSCYSIRYDSGELEKGCDAIGCPSAIAKTKVHGGRYDCCNEDSCNKKTPA